MQSDIPSVFINDIGSCAYNSVLIGLFSLSSFNKGVKDYLYKHVNNDLLRQIENNVDVLNTYSEIIKQNTLMPIHYYNTTYNTTHYTSEQSILMEVKDILYFEFIILCYYIIAKKAEYTKGIFSSYIKIFVLYIIILRKKYKLFIFPETIKFIEEYFETKFNLDSVDEINDNFDKYFSTIKEMSTYKCNYGDDPFLLMDTILKIFATVYKKKKNKKTRDMYNMIYKLFVINNDKIKGGFIHYSINSGLEFLKNRLLTTSIIIIHNEYYKYLGKLIDDCESSQVDTTDKNFIKTVFKYPEFINSKNHKLVLKAKFLLTFIDEEIDNKKYEGLHSEIIIRYFKDNKYYRINNNIAIKCGCNNDMKNFTKISNFSNKYYTSTCNNFNCFDNFTEFALYEVCGACGAD